MTGGPLAGVRVLDISSVVVGPICTLRLAQYGAEVVKIESRDGDLMRSLGGPSPTGAHSGAYLHMNCGKRAATLDLKVPAALDALKRLVGGFDALVSNMRPAALARLGLDVETLRGAHPRLIHCTISGFGPGGRYRSLPAYDSVLQGVSGIAGLTGARDGTAAYVPLLLCDHVVGEITAGAIAAALYQREKTGTGSAIEVPMFETMAAFVLQEHLARQSFVPPLGPAGDIRMLDSGARPLKTADGWISLTTNTNAQVHGFLRAVERTDLIGDPRFASVADRVRNMREWFAIRDDALLRRPTDEWLAIFRDADVPAMPCHTLETLTEDPHLRDVALLHEERHVTEGVVRSIRPTILHDGATLEPGKTAQPQGWETRLILAEAGLDEDEIVALIASGAAVQADTASR